MNLALHLKMVGFLLIILALAHPYFARRFDWRKDTATLTLLNRQIFYVHAFFLTLTLVFFGILSGCYTYLLIDGSDLGKLVLAGFVIFWSTRLGFQLFVYSPTLWRGNRFNTAAHVFFTLLWTYFVAVYGAALWAHH